MRTRPCPRLECRAMRRAVSSPLRSSASYLLTYDVNCSSASMPAFSQNSRNIRRVMSTDSAWCASGVSGSLKPCAAMSWSCPISSPARALTACDSMVSPDIPLRNDSAETFVGMSASASSLFGGRLHIGSRSRSYIRIVLKLHVMTYRSFWLSGIAST